MRNVKRIVLLFTLFAVALLGTSTGALASAFTFELSPLSGDVSGPAGSTVGWGYSFLNPSDTEWLVITGLSADLFSHGVPDPFLFDFPILGPGTSLDVAYAAGIAGLFELAWDPAAPIGFVNSGTFVVSAEWWDGDPFLDGSFLRLADDQSAPYSATVAPATLVPEPGTLLLFFAGLAGMGVAARRG